MNPHRLAVWLVLCAAAVASSRASAGTIDTIVGTGKPVDNGAPGPAVKTNVGNPFGVELGPGGALFVCEVSNHRVWRMDPVSGKLAVAAGSGRQGYAGDGAAAADAVLNEPYEVRFDGRGNMFFVEMKNHLVRRVDAKSGRISTVAGTGTAGYGGDGGPATRATFRSPHSIALDGRGGLYIADIGNHRIRRVDLARGTVESIAGTGERKLPVDGATARGKPMLGPRALAIDGRTLWIALRQGHSVWALDLDRGTLRHVAGTGQKGYSGDGGPAQRATFNGPKGIAVGPQGNVYVVDTENQAIRRIDVRSGTISTVAGFGPTARGFAGDGGPATSAKLNRPHGICVGPDGTIYLGDSENHRVRRVRGR